MLGGPNLGGCPGLALPDRFADNMTDNKLLEGITAEVCQGAGVGRVSIQRPREQRAGKLVVVLARAAR